MIIDVDTETRARVDLKKVGAHRYIEDPDFALLLLGWSADGGPVEHAEFDDAYDVVSLLLEADELWAHYAAFDRLVLGTLDKRLAEPDRWHCTMVAAAEAGLPQSLDQLARAVGAEEKDTAGTRLINMFSKPNGRTGAFRGPETDPESWELFVDYLHQDVATLADVRTRLPELLPSERRLWLADQRINDRGVRVDVETIPLAIAADTQNKADGIDELKTLTGLANPNSVQQLGGWLGVRSLAADAVEAELAKETDPDRHRVLELRQVIAGTAVKKYEAARLQVCADGRARGQFRFFGAHTGRWSGKGIQLQNLPRASFKTQAQRDAVLLDLQLGLGATPDELKALIRPMLLGPLTVVDFAQIEARVIAWLAGERWVLDAFSEGRDIYTETAQAMGPQFTRQQGKTAVLACGFGGSVGALLRMGATGTDEELLPIVQGYRKANPNIVRLWYGLWDALLYGTEYGRLRVRTVGHDRHLVLPSGRAIVYRDLRRYDGDWWFHGGRARTKLWHGIIAENVTQAVARDLLAAAILRLEDELGPVLVGHVHDEVILEGRHDVDQVIKLMCDAPAWADGLPVGAEGHIFDRYQK